MLMCNVQNMRKVPFRLIDANKPMDISQEGNTNLVKFIGVPRTLEMVFEAQRDWTDQGLNWIQTLADRVVRGDHLTSPWIQMIDIDAPNDNKSHSQVLKS